MSKKLNGKPLTMQQEEFCRIFVSPGEFFGNGVQSYIQAFGVDVNKKGAYACARTTAWKLLTNIDIIAKINVLLEDIGLNDSNVDKQLFLVINQSADFSSKVAAIREYNKLKKRIDEGLKVENNINISWEK